MSDVDDEWVEAGALFDLEDGCDGCWVECVCTEAVDGFGWEGDDSTLFDDLCSAGDILRCGVWIMGLIGVGGCHSE